MTHQRSYPWSSFSAFLQAVELFGEKAPAVFDASMLDFAKGYADQIIAIMRFFGFATANNIPTELFKRFVREKDDRHQMFAEILRQSYPDVFSRVKDTIDITDALLVEVLGQYSESEISKRKIVTFFKNAANYAEMPISATMRTPRAAIERSQLKMQLSDRPQQSEVLEEGDTIPPILLSLMKDLPPVGMKWSPEKRRCWLLLVENAIAYYYPDSSESST